MSVPILIYCSADDLTDFGIQAKAIAAIPKPTLDRKILAASRRIDSYLRSRFTLPLVGIDDDIRECCAKLVAYSLLSTRGFNPDAGADETFRLREKEAIAWLDRVADGRAVPNVTDSSVAAKAGQSTARPQSTSSSQRGWSDRGDPNGPSGPFGFD